MLFLKKPPKFILLTSISIFTIVVSAQEPADQIEPNTAETLILEQDETAINESDSKWDFIEHEESESEITEYEAQENSESSNQLNDYDAITIYIDASWGYRTERAASNLTKSHQEYAAQGYQFVDLELYLEDSDLKGFFVTYERSSN